MGDSIPWRIVRYLYAAYYLFIGVYLALSLAGIIAPPHPRVSVESAAFQGALGKTGFMFPLLAFTYIASACALFFHRTAPLGLVLLAPVAVIIFFTDTLLDTAWVLGTLNAVVLAALAWHFRSAYRPLFSYSAGLQGAVRAAHQI
ncbi:MAG: hypothetical protein J0H27_11925 [Xanthomonadales bacterium]|nr:hypothetical protein [Xanthomonadales bacterium]ODU92028.1 MAG: hypothetical protein ABT18_14275 [Rhodanobacter sp. SCN 66-43]OJY84916.1 MAG: hypothetical protein BGP23_10950 [Xanthomonadales bacterium 66-474]